MALAFANCLPLTSQHISQLRHKCARRKYFLKTSDAQHAVQPTMTAANTPKPSSGIPLAPQVSDVWELDFYSRPVIGLDGKKLWELIITDTTGSFEHVEAIPNSLVNSRDLRKRIATVIDDATTKPTVIRFFRMQMRNMISIALADLDVEVRPSRRTYALQQAIRYREADVYPAMPGFNAALLVQPTTFAGPDLALTQKLPDALRCDSFAFAQFPLGQLQQFFAEADSREYFGEMCLVDPALSPDVLVPGLVVHAVRAPAIAGWMSGIELATVQVRLDKQDIVFECGLDTKYKFGAVTKDIRDEAKSFQTAKQEVGGLHFLAVQKSESADEIDGFWLLCDI